jgi:hypothetical protein
MQNWNVEKIKGKFKRRTKDESGNELAEDHIDIEWKGYGKKPIIDQLTVPKGTDDKIIEGMLNEKQKVLEERLKENEQQTALSDSGHKKSG